MSDPKTGMVDGAVGSKRYALIGMSSAAKNLVKTAPTLAEADGSGNAGITLFPCAFVND